MHVIRFLGTKFHLLRGYEVAKLFSAFHPFAAARIGKSIEMLFEDRQQGKKVRVLYVSLGVDVCCVYEFQSLIENV